MPRTVAVIGLGYFGRQHLAAWAGLAGARLVAMADPDPGARAAAAAQLASAQAAPVAAHADAGALLAAEDPEIVDIVAPPGAHAALVALAARSGRTVICQKPFCRSLSEARAVTEAAEAAGATLVVHENFRFQPWHRTARALLAEGRLGTPWQARFALRPGDGRGPRAYLDRQPSFQVMPRFLLRETGVHFIDLFTWLLGPARAVYADLRRLNPAIAGEDAGLMVIEHAGGARSVFDGNRLSDHVTDQPRRTMGEMEIEGEAGTLRLDGAGRLWLRGFGAADWQAVPLAAPVDDRSFGGGCVAALCAHVLEALGGTRPLENAARDYLAVRAVEEAAYRSAAEGRRIAL